MTSSGMNEHELPPADTSAAALTLVVAVVVGDTGRGRCFFTNIRQAPRTSPSGTTSRISVLPVRQQSHLPRGLLWAPVRGDFNSFNFLKKKTKHH